MFYDALGRQTHVVDALGVAAWENASGTYATAAIDLGGLTHTTVYTYDANNNIETVTDAKGNTTTYTYDALGRIVKEAYADPDGAGSLASPEIEYIYDANGNVIKTIDAKDNETWMFYDALGRQTHVMDTLGVAVWVGASGTYESATANLGNLTHATIYTYDTNGNVETVTDALGNVTTYTYDALGRVVKETYADPDGIGPLASPEVEYVYDANGNVIKTIDAEDNETWVFYDALGRKTHVMNADSVQQWRNANGTYETALNNFLMLDYTESYGYNTNGELTIYEYDALHRVTSEFAVPKVNFSNKTVTSYDSASGQDGQNGTPTSYEILEDGNTIKLEGNAWKKIVYSTTLTSDSILTFEFKTDSLGEIHAIGMDKDNDWDNQYRLFQVAGTDAVSHVIKNAYTSTELSDGWVRIEIQIGQYYTGEMNYLCFLNDDDATYDAVSYFRNIVVFDFAQQETTAIASTGYIYDAAGNVISTIDPEGNQTWMFYDALGRQTHVMDAIGVAAWLEDTNNDYDTAKAALLSASAEDDDPTHVTSYTYDAVGNVIAVTDALSQTTTYEYDALHRLTHEHLPGSEAPSDSLLAHWSLDEGQGSTAADLTGNGHDGTLGGTVNPTWTDGRFDDALSFDGQNYVVVPHSSDLSFTAADSYTLSAWIYVPELPNAWKGVIAKSRNNFPWYGIWISNSNQWNFGRCGSGTKNIAGSDVTVGWHHVAIVQDAVGGTAKIFVDGSEEGSSSTLYDADGTGALYIGGCSMSSERFTGAVDDVRIYSRALTADELEAMARDTDRTTVTAYDAVGNITSYTDADGNETTYTYDALNRLENETNALSDARSYEYDLAGNLIQQTDRNGRITRYEYDVLNRQTHEKWIAADGTTVLRDIESIYDNVGWLESIDDGTTSYTYTYDALGRVTQVVSTQLEFGTSTTTYSYDDNSNLKTMANTLLGTYTYEYDGMNRLTAVIYNDGTLATGDKRVDYTYDDISQYDTVTYRDGVDLQTATVVATADYDFDQLGRLTGLAYAQGSTALAGYSYEYDDAGNMVSMISDNDGTSDYDYDETNQLTAADHDYQADESYTYDDNGNRLDTGFTYDGDNRLTSDGVFNYGY
ncbi:MAG TPA: hypothetical protein PKK48_07830, partial [Phycisphaerae bacterium]|nr:hypothetical protein [Phycisphaerae bacterium]